MDFLGYKNKRVIVSGCFSGMGEATARQLVELGAQVHGIDYKETEARPRFIQPGRFARPCGYRCCDRQDWR